VFCCFPSRTHTHRQETWEPLLNQNLEMCKTFSGTSSSGGGGRDYSSVNASEDVFAGRRAALLPAQAR
jgi:hypothetical protein